MTKRHWIGRFCAQGEELELAYKEVKSVTFAAATTGAVASKELFAVTGTVLACVVPVCETDLTGSGSIQLGVAGATNSFVAVTVGADIDVGELWLSATPATRFAESDTVPQWQFISGSDIGYEVTVNTLTAGVIKFYCYYFKISDDAKVEAAGINVAL